MHILAAASRFDRTAALKARRCLVVTHHRVLPMKASLAVSSMNAHEVRSDVFQVRRLSASIELKATSEPPSPTSQQLRRHFLNAAIPMVGFGMMDNFIMIQAGDLIDSTLGVRFGLATLAAAACGQVCSDFSGVCFGGVIDALAAKLGLPPSGLTDKQLPLRKVKNVGVAGAAIGVVIGCCIGMSSLFFMDLEKAERMKKQAELATLFETIMEHGHRIMKVQHCTLWLVEDGSDGKKRVSTRGRGGGGSNADALRQAFVLWDTDGNGKLEASEVQVGLSKIGRTRTIAQVRAMIGAQSPKVSGELDFDEFKALLTNTVLKEVEVLPLQPTGLKGQVYSSKQILNLDFTKGLFTQRTQFDAYTGYSTRSILISPIMDSEGKVVGMVEMVNKLSADGSVISFDIYDERMIEMLSVHAGIFIEAAA